jgi:hypothetical protein
MTTEHNIDTKDIFGRDLEDRDTPMSERVRRFSKSADSMLAVLALDEDATPDWDAARATLSEFENDQVDEDHRRFLEGMLMSVEAQFQTDFMSELFEIRFRGSKLYVGTTISDWGDGLNVSHALHAIVGTGALEAAGFEVVFVE